MNRRWLIGAGLAITAGRQVAWAQPMGSKPRIGWLSAATPDPATLRTQVEPFRQGLRALGWIEFRWAEGRFERLPAFLDELLRLDLDLLVTTSPRPAMLAKEAPKTLAIVALAIDDPVQMGLAPSIARPGGNITGISAAFAGLVAAEGHRARGAPVCDCFQSHVGADTCRCLAQVGGRAGHFDQPRGSARPGRSFLPSRRW